MLRKLWQASFFFGTMLIVLAIPVAASNPNNWFCQNGDPLNYQSLGADYQSLANLSGYTGWTYQGQNMSDTNADVGIGYILEDYKIGKGDTFCQDPSCRNHARLWGIPTRGSTDTIAAASFEHWPGFGDTFTHYVDSFDGGRDGLFNDLYSSGYVTSAYFVQQYGGNCIMQPNGVCAPYDGRVGYQEINLNPGAAPQAKPANAVAVPSSSKNPAQYKQQPIVKPVGDPGKRIPLPLQPIPTAPPAGTPPTR